MATSRLSTRRVEWRVQVGTSNKPGQGLVIFEASVSYIPDPLAAGGPRTAIPEPVAAVLDASGYTCTPAAGDPSAPGERGVALFTTDSLGEDGGDWTWTARPQLRSVDGIQMANAVPAFSFAVPSGAGSLDLAEVQKIPASPGLGTEQAVALVLRAEKAVQEALVVFDDTVTEKAEAAVAAEIINKDVVLGSDPGIPTAGESSSVHSMIWKNPFHQMVMALTDRNMLKLFKGLELDGLAMTASADDEYLKATRNAAGRVAEDALMHNGNVPPWILKRWKDRMGLGANVTNTVYTVKPDGTGTHRTPKEANASFTPGPGLTCEIIVHPGTYTDTEWVVKEGVTIRGTARDACRLEGSLPATATDAQISGTSTLWLRKTARLENLTITARNMRYPVHSEDSGSSPNARHDVVNCWIEHHGNDDVRDYRAANGLPAGNVWSGDKAWGYGSSSGVYERFENVTFISPNEAWYVHDNKDFTKPINHDLIGCRILCRNGDGIISLQSLGSGQDSRVNIYGSEVTAAYVYDQDSPWSTEDPAKQVAQHSQISLTMDGMAPVGYRSVNRGRALKIESASTGAISTVRVSGSAADAVFGTGTYRDGGGGLKGYGYGYWDISGILVGPNTNVTVNNTLGRRLGDCTTTPKTLSVTFNGGTPVKVVFSGNHTNDTNVAILATINAALGPAGTATEYAVTQGETYPDFTSRQRTVKNTGTTGIPRFAPVQAASGPAVSLMGTGTAKMAGVALEQIPPGSYGRILTSGLLSTSQLHGFSGGVNPGTAVYLSDTTPGTFAASGTRLALTGYLSGWARF